MIQDYCNRIHFCITVDEENLISAGVTLVSLLKNKPENTPLSIHLLADNLPEKEMLYLKNLQKALSAKKSRILNGKNGKPISNVEDGFYCSS